MGLICCGGSSKGGMMPDRAFWSGDGESTVERGDSVRDVS